MSELQTPGQASELLAHIESVQDRLFTIGVATRKTTEGMKEIAERFAAFKQAADADGDKLRQLEADLAAHREKLKEYATADPGGYQTIAEVRFSALKLAEQQRDGWQQAAAAAEERIGELLEQAEGREKAVKEADKQASDVRIQFAEWSAEAIEKRRELEASLEQERKARASESESLNAERKRLLAELASLRQEVYNLTASGEALRKQRGGDHARILQRTSQAEYWHSIADIALACIRDHARRRAFRVGKAKIWADGSGPEYRVSLENGELSSTETDDILVAFEIAGVNLPTKPVGV